jgi:hypothetical protein
MTEKGNSNTEKSSPDSKTQFTCNYETISLSDNEGHCRSNRIACIIGICEDCGEYRELIDITTFHRVNKHICQMCIAGYSYITLEKRKDLNTGAAL